MSNLFFRKDGTLDRRYLRTCACYKLLKQKKITPQRAIELMEASGTHNAANTVALWKPHLRAI